jgi:outer membrane lipase/esterase
MHTAKPSLRRLAAAGALAWGCTIAPSAQAIPPELFIAETLQPVTMYAGFIAPVTSKEFLTTLGYVFNNVPFFNTYYGLMEDWLPRARKWSITPPGPINPTFRVPPAHDDIYVPNGYTQIFAFGDSMSDTGNLFKMTEEMTQSGMPAAPSYKGRFSNGVVALEVMANQLRLPMTNYSFSGAQTGHGNLLPFWSWQKGTLFQIEEFHRTLAKQGIGRNDPEALYFVWAGPNDFFEGLNMYSSYTAKNAANNLLKGIRMLYGRGSRHFLVPLMPDFSLTPQSAEFNRQDKSYTPATLRRAEEFKAEMLKMLANARREMPDIDLRTFDSMTFLRTEMANARARGVNVTEACYNGKLVGREVIKTVCDDPDNYLFWDKNHPTDAASRVLGLEFTKAATAP